MLSTVNSQETDSLCFFFLPSLELTNTIDIYSAVQSIGPETPQQAIPALLQDAEPRQQAVWWVLHTAQRRLAWHLLGHDWERLTWKNLAAALYSPRARLRRAQHLLRYAEQQECIGQQTAAKEAWGWVDEEWRWVATAPAVKHCLVERAHTLGMPEPESMAQAVLDAVTGELLPILHLKWYLLSMTAKEMASRRAPHQAFLTNWRTSTGATDGLAQVYLWYVETQTEKLATPADHTVENITIFLEKGRITIQTADRLVEALAHSVAAWLPSWSSAQPDLTQINKQLSLLRRVEQAGPSTVALMELLSLLYFLRASKQSTMTAAIADLTQALSYDPFNRHTQEQWRRLEGEVIDLRQRLPTLDAAAQVTARRLLESVEKSMQDAAHFNATPRGQQLMERRQQAVRAELARRLGLAPYDENTAELLDGLTACLRESRHLANDAEAFSIHVRQVAEARGGLLMTLDWERIETALREAPIPNEGILALFLPRSALISLDESLAPALEIMRENRTKATALPEPGSGRLHIGTWLFSTHDLVVKLTAIAGVLLCLHGGGVTTEHFWRDRAVTRAYADVLADLQREDDQAVVAHAIDYLERVDADLQYPRTPQIIGFLREAVLREVIRLVNIGSDEAATALLRRFEQTMERFSRLADNLRGLSKEGSKL